MTIEWSISFNDEKNNQKGIEKGYWSISALDKIVEMIETFFDDITITEWLRKIIEV